MWITWLAAVRFSPVPPAFSDRTNSAGSADSFFSSRRRHPRSFGDWSSDVCSSDLEGGKPLPRVHLGLPRRRPRGPLLPAALLSRRSEERRVGKEGRSRWSPYH